MKIRYSALVWLAAAALALPATAQDETPEPPAGETPPPADQPADAAGAAEDEREAEGEAQAEAEEAEATEEREFIFSEEIPADQQVTFPVDI